MFLPVECSGQDLVYGGLLKRTCGSGPSNDLLNVCNTAAVHNEWLVFVKFCMEFFKKYLMFSFSKAKNTLYFYQDYN